MRATEGLEGNPDNRTRGVPSWRPVLMVAAAGSAVVMILLMVVQGELIPPVAAFVLLALVGLVLLGVRERAGIIMLAVLSILFLAVNIPFIVPSLSVPESTVDFLVSALTVLGLAAMAVSAIALLRHKPGGAMPFAGTISVLAVVAVGIATVARLGYEAAEARPGDVEVVLENIEFSPATIDAEGAEVSVFLDNKDTVLHTFTIEELDVDVTVPGNGSARVTFEADPGTYEFICEPHQPDMDGNLRVGS